MTAQAQLASFLLAIATGRGQGHPITVPMSRTEIADYLGMSVKGLTHELLQFVDAKLVSILNISQVEIVDEDALEKVAYDEPQLTTKGSPI